MFRRFSAGQRKSVVGAVALLALEAVTAVYLPSLIGALIDFLGNHRTWSVLGFTTTRDTTIQTLAVAIVLATALNSLADSLAEISLGKVGRTLGYHLRVALFAHLQRLSLTFHLGRRTGDVLTRITGDVQALEEFVVDSVSDLVGSFMLLAGTLAWLFYRSVQVAVLALVIVPLLAAVSNFFARRIKAASKVTRAREGELASTAQEMLGSIGVVQIYGRADYEENRFAEQSRSAMRAVLTTARLEAGFSFTVSVLEAAVIAAVVWLGALVVHPAIPAGLLITFILQIQNMFKPTRRIIKQWNVVGKIYASVERVGDLLDRKPAVIDRSDAVAARRLTGAIEFRDVSFAYDSAETPTEPEDGGRLALDGLNFEIAPGEVVALVGHSGAGKSTIAQLVPRLYDPHAGSVLIDGQDIRDFTLASLRSQIAMVLQETVLFSGTVADNIAYGRPGASRDEVEAAARRACAHEFICGLPDGYDTVLGERAATLSGGQRQRLAIARAFIRDAPILILDEPTTGLDAESARGVLDALRELVRGRSAIIVSHDFKLIGAVDRILVLSAGRLLEDGTPADLLARGGVYAKLYAQEFGSPAQAAPLAELNGRRRLGQAGAEPVPTAPGATRQRPGRHRRDTEPFDDVLTTAMPRPASAQAFRALTGRAPSVGMRPLGEADVDPTLSPALNRAWPGLVQALDPDAMAPVLQDLLVDGWRVAWCTPERPLVQPGEGICLRYQVGLREPGSSRVVERLIAGRLFNDVDGAAEWLAESVLPLAAVAAGRADVSPFDRLAMLLPSLRLVLHAFPVDPDRPGLIRATDPTHLNDLLTQALGDTAGGLELAECRPHVVRYDRERCVIRYEVMWNVRHTGRVVKQVMYGKVYDGPGGAGVERAAARLSALPTRTGGRSLVIPRFRAYLPEQQLVLLDAIPGRSWIGSLVREAAADPARLATLYGAVESAAEVTATLHHGSYGAGPLRTLDGECADARAEIAAVAPWAPALAASLAAELDLVEDGIGSPSGPPAFAHGDLTPGQLLFDGPLIGLVDLDRTGAAERALDLGSFTSALAVSAVKAHPAGSRLQTSRAAELGGRYLSAYRRAAGLSADELSAARVGAYRRVSLVRTAVRSWRQLKPARVMVAQQLLADSRREDVVGDTSAAGVAYLNS